MDTGFYNALLPIMHAVGSMENFIYDYYIRPIWDKTGYNIVNTMTYALIAIIALYLINLVLKKRIKIDQHFIIGILSFVLFGSTMRVVTDSIDNGIFTAVTPIHQIVIDSHIWDYGYLTVTPGIYILTAALLLISIAILYKVKMMEHLHVIGLALWLPHFILLIPFMKYWPYALPIFLMSVLPTLLAMRYLKNPILAAVVAAQALDGAATFFVIDVFSKISGIIYFEQHVLSSAIGNFAGTYFIFYLVKALLAFGATYLILKEDMNEEDKNYIALILMIIGFAPGLRDVLRMVVGA